MDENVLDTKRYQLEFERELADVERFSDQRAVPAVLELVGKLGALNRCGISLVEAAGRDAAVLGRRAGEGDARAQEALQRMMLELRDLNERVENGLEELANDHAVLSESLEITGEVVAYLQRMRELLSGELWKKS